MVTLATLRRQNSGESSSNPLDSGGKYVRYTPEQVKALEQVYAESPKPSASRRQQLVKECPPLANVEQKQIKIWFQNRRSRDKQRTESSNLQSINRKLRSLNKLLLEENSRLQKHVSQLVYENGCIRQLLRSATGTSADGSSALAVTTPQNSLKDDTYEGLFVIAEKTLAEFLSKASGTSVDWVPMPGLKPGPDSIGIYAIPQSGGGVAARACGFVGLEPPKIAELLKDRPSWFRDCRSHEVFTSVPTANGGTIELVYTQMFAPTILVPARDLWTLRYTTLLENGSLAVCEKSLFDSDAAPSMGEKFVRAEMLPSGYLIRSCDGSGSIIHIVDHLNLKPWSVPEVLRPLYTSSKLVAQKMTIPALNYLRQIARETNGEVAHEFGRQPAVLRTFAQRLSRGFNDAVSGFSDAGWSVMNYGAGDDVTIAVNLTKNLNSPHNAANSFSMSGGILCAKASMLLRNVPPAALVQFLRERRSEWAIYDVDAYSAISMKTNANLGLGPMSFSENQNTSHLGYTIQDKEMLEVIQIEGRSPDMPRDIHLLQMCSETDVNSTGACAELIFAPINEKLPDDVPLLPSGFCIIPLDSQSEQLNGHRNTLSPTAQASDGAPPVQDMRSVLAIAFQFPFESNSLDSITTMSRQYVRSVITSIQKFAMVIAPPPEICPTVRLKYSLDTPQWLILAQWVCRSFSHHFGADLLREGPLAGDLMLKQLWHHSDAILCCSIKAPPALIFANQAGLNMLETTLAGLQDLSLDKIFDEFGLKALRSEFPKIMQQGFSILPAGICMSTMGRPFTYAKSVVWKVLAGNSETVHCLAFSFINWTFLGT
ncbi:unnamed protein product [Rhodiola kirilowii]